MRKWIRVDREDAREHGASHPRFSTNRVVREYTEKYYVPAAVAYGRGRPTASRSIAKPEQF